MNISEARSKSCKIRRRAWREDVFIWLDYCSQSGNNKLCYRDEHNNKTIEPIKNVSYSDAIATDWEEYK